MTGERPWPKKEAGSPPRRRSGPSPTRVQRATARAGMQGAITMHQGLTDSGANSRVHHFNLSSHGTKKIRKPGAAGLRGGHVLSDESTGQNIRKLFLLSRYSDGS